MEKYSVLFVIVNNYHEKTKGNNVLFQFSILNDFSALSKIQTHLFLMKM